MNTAGFVLVGLVGLLLILAIWILIDHMRDEDRLDREAGDDPDA